MKARLRHLPGGIRELSYPDGDTVTIRPNHHLFSVQLVRPGVGSVTGGADEAGIEAMVCSFRDGTHPCLRAIGWRA